MNLSKLAKEYAEKKIILNLEQDNLDRISYEIAKHSKYKMGDKVDIEDVNYIIVEVYFNHDTGTFEYGTVPEDLTTSMPTWNIFAEDKITSCDESVELDNFDTDGSYDYTKPSIDVSKIADEIYEDYNN